MVVEDTPHGNGAVHGPYCTVEGVQGTVQSTRTNENGERSNLHNPFVMCSTTAGTAGKIADRPVNPCNMRQPVNEAQFITTVFDILTKMEERAQNNQGETQLDKLTLVGDWVQNSAQFQVGTEVVTWREVDFMRLIEEMTEKVKRADDIEEL